MSKNKNANDSGVCRQLLARRIPAERPASHAGPRESVPRPPFPRQAQKTSGQSAADLAFSRRDQAAAPALSCAIIQVRAPLAVRNQPVSGSRFTFYSLMPGGHPSLPVPPSIRRTEPNSAPKYYFLFRPARRKNRPLNTAAAASGIRGTKPRTGTGDFEARGQARKSLAASLGRRCGRYPPRECQEPSSTLWTLANPRFRRSTPAGPL